MNSPFASLLQPEDKKSIHVAPIKLNEVSERYRLGHASANHRTIDECETGFNMTISGFKLKFSERFVTASVIMTLLGGCSMDDGKNKVSDDLGALRKVVDIPTELKSGHWEIFGTPEYTGGVPGPTDYMTLVAEIEPSDKSKGFLTNAGYGTVYIVPEAARPWVSNAFRSILEKHKNTALDLSTVEKCHAYVTKLTKTGNPVHGFACENSGRIFLYISLL